MSGGSSDRVNPVDWDAATYDRVANPQEEWGREVLARLTVRGDERALDAGCGSGRVTRHLLDLLPDGHVTGVDASPSMIEHAGENLAEYGDRVDLVVSDLLELQLPAPVDVVFSNAVFHWVLDHQRLFDRIFAALAPGGVIEAQCGGEGNVAEFKDAVESCAGDERFSAYLRGMPDVQYFASVGDTEARLQRSGFEIDRLWLERRDASPDDPAAFLASVGLTHQLKKLPPDLHDEFVAAVIGGMPRPFVLRYVRLNISARRPAAG